ncbi:Thiamine pyrophosphate protein TPP binding domain protein [beta proteobacterium CB]|nr:Thiamine pyrophosphate protein TPP binding domain protein [beta proteobacterium CB]
MRVADYIIKQLQNFGIDTVFLVPGGGAMYLDDAVASSGMRYTACLHEQATGISAEAYGRYHPCGLGVAIVTSGPGSTNVITPVAGAYIESNPLLVISGQVKRSDLNTGGLLRQSGVQEVDTMSMVKNITKCSILIDDPLSIKSDLERCIALAMTPRCGPSWLDVPLDIQAFVLPEDYPDIDFKLLMASYANQSTEFNPVEIISQIQASKRPLLLVGQGVRGKGDRQLLKAFSETFQIPVISTFPALDLFEYDHHLYVGRPGGVSMRSANFAVQNCDLLISVGSSLNNVITAFNPKNFAADAAKILVDIDPHEIEKHALTQLTPVVSDAKNFLRSVMKSYSESGSIQRPDTSEWVAFTAWLKNTYANEYQHFLKKSSEHISHYEAIDVLSDVLPVGANIATGSSGLGIEVFYAFFKNKLDQKISITSGLGSMGFGLSSAIGASQARPGSQIFCVEGDGSLQMNIQELAVVAGDHLPITLIIFNNSGYASIRNTQINYFEKRFIGTGEQSGLHIPALKKIAEGYSIPYLSAKTVQDLTMHLKQSIGSLNPLIIEVFLDPDEKLFPKVQAHISDDGKITSMPIEDMSPLLPIEELKLALKYANIKKESYEARGLSSEAK